jgi:hypothetical protein
MFRGRGGGGRGGGGNCGRGDSGDGGGDNDNNDNGGGDNDNDGIDDNDNGGNDKDDDVSDDDHNGGNSGDGGGGCNTATAVGIDRQVNNQLKEAIDTGRGRPRGGGRGHGQWRHGSSLWVFLFCILQRMWLGNNAVCPEKFFSRQKSKTPFLTWTVLFALLTSANFLTSFFGEW